MKNPQMVREIIAPGILVFGATISGFSWYTTGNALDAFCFGLNLGILLMMLVANYFMRVQDQTFQRLLNITEQMQEQMQVRLYGGNRDATSHPFYH